MLDVARESYALTVWVHWHLKQQEKLRRIERGYDRIDLAGLMAIGYHNPAKLSGMLDEYRNRVSDPLSRALRTAMRDERVRKMLADHQRMVLIPTPENG